MKIRLYTGHAVVSIPIIWAILCVVNTSHCEDFLNIAKNGEYASSDEIYENISSTNSSEPQFSSSDNVHTTDLKVNNVVQSSFEESVNLESTLNQPQFTEVISQNAGVSNDIIDGSTGILVTLVNKTTPEQNDVISSQISDDISFSNVTEDAAEKANVAENASEAGPVESQQTEKNVFDVPKIEPKENLTEEIPSFSEWAQKQLEEDEKKREEVNASAHNQSWNSKATNNMKVRSKNYASPNCGAKIVASNPEAVSPSSILSPSRDEYKLNACTSRIWFIVELCEAIQAKKIDLANFELFSSSPKDFSISVSDRYPSREWSNVGHFTAKDERDIQSFDLNPHLFGKYIKLEMHSHHGSEHFCPISLFRVYGTSEFEVLEKEDQPHSNIQDDDDDDDALDSEGGQGTKNLFSSATDAVMSIVKKAAEVLGNKGNMSNQTSEIDNKNKVNCTILITTCTTPSHIVVCNNCSDMLFGKVFELLSCKTKYIKNLMNRDFISKTIYNTDICTNFGLDFRSKQSLHLPAIYSSYLKTFFPTSYLAAICNTFAIIENKVVLNISNQLNNTNKGDVGSINQDIDSASSEATIALKSDDLKATQDIINTINVSKINETVMGDVNTSDIQPTRTQMPDEVINITDNTPDIKSQDDVVKPTSIINEGMINQVKDEAIQELGSADTPVETTNEFESAENIDIDNLISDFENFPVNSATPSPPQVKESVFLRLSNRIKTLERNMSLSSQYLEELSRRYKKQVEEMQRLLDKTVTALNEESKRKDERNDRLEQRITQLTEIVEALVAEKNNSFNPLHCFLLIVMSMFLIFTFCRRNEHKFPDGDTSVVEIQRRKSIDVINHNTPAKKQRRPSEEVMKISGTYTHLLVDEMEQKKKLKDRKQKKKKNLQRSNSINTLSEENLLLLSKHATWSDVATNCKLTNPCKIVWDRQESAPPTCNVTWTEDSEQMKHGIEDIPFVLDDCDISPLQDMPLPKPLQESANTSTSNGDALQQIPNPYSRTAFELRKARKLSNGVGEKPKNRIRHQKSASLDETKRQNIPPTDTVSLNIKLEDTKLTNMQKKEKKGTFKKIFKKVF